MSSSIMLIKDLIVLLKNAANTLSENDRSTSGFENNENSLDELYKSHPKEKEVTDPELAKKFLNSGKRVKYDGGVFPHKCVGLTFNYHDFLNVSSKDAEIQSCDFKYSTFNGVYFKGAKFTNCDFTGARFKDCNLKDCVFIGCNFKYTEFNTTHIPTAEILLNLPSWLNVRRDLMKSLRKNAESVGDTHGTKVFIREEIKADKEYCREAWKQTQPYYREKYPNLFTRLKFFLRACGFALDNFFWGHGEYPQNLVRFILITVFTLSFVVLFTVPNLSLESTSVTSFLNLYCDSVIATLCSFLGVVPSQGLPTVPEYLRLVLALFRYVALGFFTTSLFRFLSRR